MPTRIYLPSTSTPPLTPTPGAGWEVTTSFTAGAASLTKTGTAYANSSSRQKGSTTAGSDRLDRIYVLDPPLAAQTITGTFSLVRRPLQSASAADAWLQAMLRVITPTGAVRGTLHGGSTATTPSSTVGAENQEFNPSAVHTRIKNALALTPVAAQAGDRLQIETGYRSASTSSTVSATARFGDPVAGADFALTSGTNGDAVPWLELSQNLTFLSALDPGAFFHSLA